VAPLLSLAVGVGAMLFLFWQFGIDELTAALREVRPLILTLALALGGIVRLGYALRWQMSAGALGVKEPLRRFVQARLAGDALGTVLPTGRISGDPVRVALLHNEGDGVTVPTTSVALDRFMEWIGNTFCATAYITLFALSRTTTASGATWILEGGMLAVLASLIAPLIMLRLGWRPFQPFHIVGRRLSPPRLRRWGQLLYDTETQLIEFFKHQPRVFSLGVIVSLLIELVILVEYRLLLSAFGLAFDWPTLMMIVVTGGLARSVPVPAGLGALEAGQVALLAIASGDAALGFVVGIVVRLHEAFWAALGFGALALSGGLERLRFLISAGRAVA
jgi:uncharacterized protein (TIRG00374 family)